MSIKQTLNLLPYLEVENYNKIRVTATDDVLGTSTYSNELSYARGKLIFELDKTGANYICTGIHNMGEGQALVIPSTHTGEDGVTRDVIAIGERAFSNNKNLTLVSLPSTITHIGYMAFSSCSNLVEITIGANVQKIDANAFYGSGIKTVTFAPNSQLEEIGSAAFERTPLSAISLPDTLKVINSRAFYGCDYLNCEIVIPESVTEIGSAAFGYSGITKLDMSACGTTHIAADTFANCYSLREVIIGESVTSIGLRAFADCWYLNYVSIGKNVNLIHPYAFDGCTQLNTCIFESNFGWFYGEEVVDYNSIINGENCTHLEVVTPLQLTQNLSEYTFFGIDKIPAPSISITEEGVLTIVDNSGMADAFNIYINNEEPITIRVEKDATKAVAIEAGTWVANDDFALPTSSMADISLAFTSHNGRSDAHAEADVDFIGIKWRNYNASLGHHTMMCYVESFAVNIDCAAYVLNSGWCREECKTLVVSETTEVSEAFYNWFMDNFTKQES